jgi:hypothetical protein
MKKVSKSAPKKENSFVRTPLPPIVVKIRRIATERSEDILFKRSTHNLNL